MKVHALGANLDGIASPARAVTVNAAGISGMQGCINDAKAAALDKDSGPAEPRNYKPLLSRLEAVRGKLPPRAN